MKLNQELVHYNAAELFAALESGRQFFMAGVKPILKWQKTELLNGEMEYQFVSDFGIMTGNSEMKLGCVEFMLPTVHLNGTGVVDLLNDARNSYKSLSLVYHQMEITGPHERDYYPQGNGAYQKAAQQHASRMVRLKAIIDEYEFMGYGLNKEQQKRKKSMRNGV